MSTVGRLEWRKGHDLALNARAKLRDLDWRYVIVGEGRTADGLKQLAGRLGLLASWGPCSPPCLPDTNFDGFVNVTDLLALLGAWGACP